MKQTECFIGGGEKRWNTPLNNGGVEYLETLPVNKATTLRAQRGNLVSVKNCILLLLFFVKGFGGGVRLRIAFAVGRPYAYAEA